MSGSASPSPSPSTPSVNVSLPDLATLMSYGSAGSGSLSTSGPDVWGTGNYGDLTVIVGRKQSGGPLASGGVSLPHLDSHGDVVEGQGAGGKTGSHPYVPLGFTSETATVNERLSSIYNMSPDQLKSLQQQLWLAGMYDGTGITSVNQIPLGQADEATFAAYGNLLSLSAKQVQRGQDVTVDETLSGLIQQRTATGQNAGGTTRTSTSYSISDPETAKAILSNVLQAYTGVGIPDGPTLAAFQSALNDYEKAHPSTTTSTYNNTGSGTDTTSEGVDSLSSAGRTQFAQDYLFQHQGGDVANYQAATTYYQAALQALGSPVQVGSNG